MLGILVCRFLGLLVHAIVFEHVSVHCRMVQPPPSDGDRHVWVVAADVAKFSPRPTESVAHWRKFLGNTVPLTHGGLVSVSLKDFVYDEVNGTHICASGSAVDSWSSCWE